MKRLVLKKLVIISQKNEVAKIIEFDKELTVITGENPTDITINRTGKSLVIKSIYHSLGGKLSKYTSNWSNLQIATILTFCYGGIDYEIYRNNDNFILRNNVECFFFSNISELRKHFVELFNFKIRMPIKKDDSNVVYAYPGAIFMPFYIDQDKGWSGSWDSFGDIFRGAWKNEVLLYHMGIRTSRYYDLLDEKVELEMKLGENKRQENTINLVMKNHLDKYKNYLDINVDLDNFANEITQLTSELNTQMSRRNEVRDELVSCFNEMKELEEIYLVAEKVHNELLRDIDYVENKESEEKIVCPICGTPHENSIHNRFHIYSEIEECEETMKKYFEEKIKIERRIQKQSAELENLESYVTKINEILNKKREKITFKEIIVAEGSKSILYDLRQELATLKNKIIAIELRLKEIRKEQTAITKAGKDISAMYLEKLRSNLQILNVIDIDSKDLAKFKPSFDSGGNDLPCAILAQVFSLYNVATRYSETVCAPIVLDAIFQQEPAEEKINKIWDFVLTMQPKNSQMVISTTEMHNRQIKGKVIRLTEERGLLNDTDYNKERNSIDRYKNRLMQYLKESK